MKPAAEFLRQRVVRPCRTAFYWAIKTLAWPVTRSYVRLRIQGASNVPARGPGIVVANHASYVDAVILGSACPRRLTFMITRPIYSLRRLRWFYYMMGSIPVAPEVPDPGAIKAAFKTLRRGDVIAIFPEGQRMPGESLGEGKPGAALIAARSGVPVIPAAIVGASRVMPVGAVLPRPYKIKVLFGEPIELWPAGPTRPSRDDLQAATDRIMEAIRGLIESAGSTRRDEERVRGISR